MEDKLMGVYSVGVKGKARFERWFDCAICGFSYPESELRMQRGKRVCPEDYDELSAEENRQRSDKQIGEEPKDLPWTPDGDDT
jgi:hypothetical protein